ncbi:MAG TPA: hypothetical protein DEH78_28280 [Solibacterales bacterium]|nr:hypothetical protein [Bryobacterales bacterium]
MRRLWTLLLCSAALFASGDFSNRRAPSWALPDSNLVHYDILDYRGKVVVLDFMAAQCVHCLEVAPLMDEVKKKFGDRVAVFSIVTYPPDTQQTVGNFQAQTKTQVPILFDCGQVTRNYLKITAQSSQRDLPHVFLIDQAGVIKNDFAYGPDNKGIFAGKGLLKEIEKLLGPAPAPKKK